MRPCADHTEESSPCPQRVEPVGGDKSVAECTEEAAVASDLHEAARWRNIPDCSLGAAGHCPLPLRDRSRATQVLAFFTVARCPGHSDGPREGL